MNDDVESVLTRRLRECVADKRLPSDFADRLVRSVRRRRRVTRIRLAVSLIVIGAFGIGLFGFCTGEAQEPSSEASITASDRPSKSEQVSGWMMLGFLRECFKRNKVNRKKEEE